MGRRAGAWKRLPGSTPNPRNPVSPSGTLSFPFGNGLWSRFFPRQKPLRMCMTQPGINRNGF